MRASQLPTARQPETPAHAATGPDPGGPAVLGRYRLLARLGAGAFATVWHARDERLDRDVALKILPRERIIGGRFEREAKAAARLSHPGIVTLYEAAVDDDGAYLVSELVRGGTLAELLAGGRLSDRDIVAIGIALCEGLEHAHARGVVHRDVKPSNILVPERPASPVQVAKLTDFGVARVVGGDSLTRTGDVLGTRAYMAPEQAEGREAGPPADLYSTALVLYEALTGVNPVPTGTAASRARRLGAHLPPLRRQRRKLPRELGQAIDMALRPRAGERGTVADLRHALTGSLDLVGDDPGVVGGPWPSFDERALDNAAPEPRPPGRSAKPWWPSRALGAAVAAGIASWVGGHLLSPAPIAPAAIALIAALLTAILPRLGWLMLVSAATLVAAAHGRPGLGVVLLAGGLLPVVLLLRAGPRWPLAAAAPALGAVALAGAWPALAGRAGTAWRRAVMAATGWLWLVIAVPLAGHALYLQRIPGVAAGSGWMSAPAAAVHGVLTPVLASGVLAPAAVWALASTTLPWIRRPRQVPLLRAAITVAWAAATAAATAIVLGAATRGHGVIMPGEGLLGAVACAFAALARELPAGAGPPAPTQPTPFSNLRSMKSP